jgi:hypothetical protein
MARRSRACHPENVAQAALLDQRVVAASGPSMRAKHCVARLSPSRPASILATHPARRATWRIVWRQRSSKSSSDRAAVEAGIP